MAECPFCRIAAGDEPAHVLYRDDDALAFLDENPAIEGHTLVIPVAHRTELITADAPVPGAVFRTVQRVARAIEDALEPDGFSVFHTSGGLVGSVDHAHVHLLPRYEADSISIALSRRPLDATAAAALRAEIKAAL